MNTIIILRIYQLSSVSRYFIKSNCICDGKNRKTRNSNFCSKEKCDMIYSEEVALRVKDKLKENLKEIFKNLTY